MIVLPDKIKQYVKLVGQGKKDSEIAKEMRVKLGTIQGSYRGKALEITGLASKQELVLYARQNGYGSPEEEIGTDSERLCRILRGPAMEPVRDFYRRLEIHYLCNCCVGCKSYHRYGVLLVNSNLEYHLEQFCPPDKDVRVFLSLLKQKNVIEVQNDNGVYRITFMLLAPQEDAC